MIIFFSFNGGGPLGFLPLLLPLVGLLLWHFTVIPAVMYPFATWFAFDPSEPWSLEDLAPLLTGVALLAMALYGFARQVQQHGLAGTFRPLGDLFGLGAPQQGAPRGPLRSRSSRPRRATSMRSKEAVERAVRALPIETYHSRDELESMTIAELKAKAQEQSVDVRGVVEKADLVAKLAEEGGTSAASCSICCEDYESGDPMRVLPCKHRFHVECADKWWLTATSYSRPPACPMCNTALLEEDREK